MRLDGAAHTGEGITDRNQSVFAHEATRYSQKVVWLQLSQNTWPKASVTSSPFSGARHLKGDMVGAFGRVKINRYTNRDGEAREELSIMADGLVSARTVPARRRAQEAGDGGSPHPGTVAVGRNRPA